MRPAHAIKILLYIATQIFPDLRLPSLFSKLEEMFAVRRNLASFVTLENLSYTLFSEQTSIGKVETTKC